MIIGAALLLVVLWPALRGLRTPGGEPRWPFLVASALSGTAVVALVVASAIALTVGRQTWNDWVSGSPSSESFTLVLAFVVGPLLFGTCIVLLIIGSVLRSRQRRRIG